MNGNRYLEKYAYFGRLINKPILSGTNLIVVIPAFNEKSIIPSLDSLYKCDPINSQIEVIVVFNSGEEDDHLIKNVNEAARKEAIEWKLKNESEHIHFHFLTAYDLPKKFAGVGFARKIGMDEAVLRFQDISCTNGVIIGFDADSTCDKNLFREIQLFFEKESRAPGCSIYFEHPLKGTDFDQQVYNGIVQYELHLRYYLQSCRFSGHPHSFHTVGSSFAVRNESYQKQGGMNRRKAGEDFYFLQKIIRLGHYKDLTTTRVIPSPRPSDRVPFGTGKAINKWLEADDQSFKTYHINTFKDLRNFFQLLPEFYLNKENPLGLFNLIPESVKLFLENYYFEDRLKEFDKHTRYINSYLKRFYNWFDAFMVLKFAHFCRDEYYSNIPITEAAVQLLELKGIDIQSNEPLDLLKQFRKLDRQ